MTIRYPWHKAPESAKWAVVTKGGRFMFFDARPMRSNLSCDGWVSWNGCCYPCDEFVPTEWRVNWAESAQER